MSSVHTIGVLRKVPIALNVQDCVTSGSFEIIFLSNILKICLHGGQLIPKLVTTFSAQNCLLRKKFVWI